MNAITKSAFLSQLPHEVKTLHDAEAMLLTLAKWDKFHHLDDDPHDVACFSPEEADTVSALMEQMDAVTRQHYGMVDAIEPHAAIWEGLVKDVTCGYLVFGADDSGKRLFVYDHGQRVRATSLKAWEEVKGKATEDDGDGYNEGVIAEWFANCNSL